MNFTNLIENMIFNIKKLFFNRFNRNTRSKSSIKKFDVSPLEVTKGTLTVNVRVFIFWKF